MKHIVIKNNQRIPFSSIPLLEYELFLSHNTELIKNTDNHCVNYFGHKTNEKITLVCCIANDENHEIYVSSCIVDEKSELSSFTSTAYAFEKYEREITRISI